LIQRLASFGTFGTARSYFKALKAMERGVPEGLIQEWRGLEQEARKAGVMFDEGVPLFSTGSAVLDLVEYCMTGFIVVVAVAFNLPPFVAGWYAGRKFPDDRNVISLWKILVGVPIFALWIGAVAVTLALFGEFLWLAAYPAVTWAGINLYHRFRKLNCAVHNSLLHPALRKRALAFRQNLQRFLADETK
jgi:hypothetical protein